MADVLVPFIVFGVPCATIAFWLWLRFRTRVELNVTLRHALDQGQALDAEAIVATFGETRPESERDHRRGLILLVIGLALIVFTAIDGIDRTAVAAAAFPILIGLAYLFLARRGSGD